MVQQIRQNSNHFAMPFVSSFAAAAAPAAAPSSEGVAKRAHSGVLDYGTGYTTAPPPNPYSQRAASKPTRVAEASPKDLEAKVRGGNLKAEDFKDMDPARAAKTIEQLVAGGKAQQANLRQLMGDKGFSKALGAALNGMDPAARQQILRIAGESGKSGALDGALDAMQPSSRNQMLRETLTGKDNAAAVAAANRYLAADATGKRAAELFESLSGTLTKRDELAKAVERLDGPAMETLIAGLSKAEDPVQTQAQFRMLGDAVFGPPKNDALRDKVRDAIKSRNFSGGELLARVAKDNFRDLDNVNNGKGLAKAVLATMSEKERDEFMKSLSGTTAADVKKLLKP